MPHDEGPGRVDAILRAGVRSIAASFPAAASLAAAWNEWEAHRRFDRIEQLRVLQAVNHHFRMDRMIERPLRNPGWSLTQNPDKADPAITRARGRPCSKQDA